MVDLRWKTCCSVEHCGLLIASYTSPGAKYFGVFFLLFSYGTCVSFYLFSGSSAFLPGSWKLLVRGSAASHPNSRWLFFPTRDGSSEVRRACACSSAAAAHLWYTPYTFSSHLKSFLGTLEEGPETYDKVWIFLVSGTPSCFKPYSSL